MNDHLPKLLIAGVLFLGSCAPQSNSTGSKTNAAELRGPGDMAELPDEPKASATSSFWDHWGDGKAELSGYLGEISRYGELRKAEVALIYVTEPMDRNVWVKDDSARDEARVDVLKLNHMATFDTGIYPYSVMTSVFAPVDDWGGARFQPTKITMTSQEWCGNVFQAVWPGPRRFRSEIHSYFAEEGDQTKVVDTPAETLYEDALFIQLRELDGAFAQGGDWSGHIVPRLWERRKAHQPLGALPATIERSEATLEGESVSRFVLTYADRRAVFDIEKEHPRRLLRWERSDGSHLRLVETTRLPYWELNGPADSVYREQLGLPLD